MTHVTLLWLRGHSAGLSVENRRFDHLPLVSGRHRRHIINKPTNNLGKSARERERARANGSKRFTDLNVCQRFVVFVPCYFYYKNVATSIFEVDPFRSTTRSNIIARAARGYQKKLLLSQGPSDYFINCLLWCACTILWRYPERRTKRTIAQTAQRKNAATLHVHRIVFILN